MVETLTPFCRQFLASGLGNIDGVYGNLNISEDGMNFQSAVNTISSKYNNTTPNTQDENLRREVEKKARDISSLSEIPYDVVLDFLWILISITDYDDMEIIVKVTEIEELKDCIGDPYCILSIKDLYKIAFLADAIISLIHKFQQFYIPDDGLSLSGMIDSIVGKLGGNIGDFGTPVNGASASTILGLQLSKLIHGVEIPMGVQTNNPQLTSPSLTGKMMFGEAPTSSALIDMNQLFAKPIAVFGDATGGSANAMFATKNVGSLSKPQSLENFVLNALFEGNMPDSGTFAYDYFKRIVDNLSGSLNVSNDTQVEMKRGDNAIPVMSSLAEVLATVNQKTPEINKSIRSNLETITSDKSGIDNLFKKGLTEQEALEKGLNASSPPDSPLPINIDIKRIFPLDLFAQGWKEMNSVMNQVQKDPNFSKVIEILKAA